MGEPEEIHKTIPVIRNFDLNPSCAHGPTVLFDRNGTRYFSCSAFRSRKLCPYFLPEEQWTIIDDDADVGTTRKAQNKKRHVSFDTNDDEDSKEGIRRANKKRRRDDKNATEGNNNVKKSSHPQQSIPLQLPNQRDKGEAQYHFTEQTVEFFIKTFQTAQVDSVICIGTPSLHEFIRDEGRNASLGLRSFLLDIDQRFEGKFGIEEFALYNMCNHHFFRDGGRASYLRFLGEAKRIAIVTDPPFGVKVELVWNGALKGVQKDFSRVKELKDREIVKSISELFWIFPYFMEGHILSKCPESGLRMSDYKIAYRNHKKFSDKGSTNNKASPVRIFTTFPLSKIELPKQSYRFCDVCNKWVDKNNLHCKLCGNCPTRDGGGTYIHCKRCKRCVKPTWFHCEHPCGKCHLRDSACRHQLPDSKIESTNSHTRTKNTNKHLSKNARRRSRNKRK